MSLLPLFYLKVDPPGAVMKIFKADKQSWIHTAMLSLLFVGTSLFAFSLCGCSVTDVQDTVPRPVEVEERGEKIYITDQTGKQWEISHAVNKYGMQPENWQYGLGPNWFAPLILPKMRCPGDPGYPTGDDFFRNFSTDLVVGAEIKGDARAYPLAVLYNHEIADENFGGIYVAVAY